MGGNNNKISILYNEADVIAGNIIDMKQDPHHNGELNIYYEGVTYNSITCLAVKLGVQKDVLAYRIRHGWPQSHWGDKAYQGNNKMGV